MTDLRVDLEQLYNSRCKDGNEKEDYVVYYIAGYMISRFILKKQHCADCFASMSRSSDEASDTVDSRLNVDDASLLTQLKNRGNLQFASSNMFSLLNIVEGQIQEYINERNVFNRDAFTDMLYNLTMETLPKVGCDEHYTTLMTNLAFDYMQTRFVLIGRQASAAVC